MSFTVTAPDNKKWQVPANSLNKAFAMGGKLADNHNQEEYKVVDPNGKEWVVPAQSLPEAFKRGGTFARHSTLDRVKEFGQEIAGGVGAVADVANKYVAAPVVHAAGGVTQLAGKGLSAAGLEGVGDTVTKAGDATRRLGQYYEKTNLEHDFSNAELLKTNLPEDKTSKIVKGAGSLVGDVVTIGTGAAGVGTVSNALKITKASLGGRWLHGINDFLKTTFKPSPANIMSAAGGGALGAALRSEDPKIGEVENIAREVIGAIVGGTIPAATGGVVKKIYTSIVHPLTTNPVDFVKNMGIKATAKVTTGKNFNEEAIAAAERIGVQLPISLVNDSKVAKFIENATLKSFFTAKIYNEVIEDVPIKIIKELNRNVDKIGTRTASTATEAGSQIASDAYKTALKKNEELWKQQADNLYEKARTFLTDADKIFPAQTLKTVKDMKESLTGGISGVGEGRKKVFETLDKLESGFQRGIHNIPARIKDLMMERTDLLKKGKYGEVTGYESYYNAIADSIAKDISLYSGNKEFITNYNAANKFYKNNIIDILRSDTARSLLKQELPKSAFDYMTTPDRIKELERILGNHPNAKALMGTLKVEKISQLLQNSGVMPGANEFNPAAFLRLFSRDSKQPLLKALMGKNFNTVQRNINPIAEAMVKNNKAFANPSGTANVFKDYSIFTGIGAGVGASIMSGNPLPAVTAAGVPISINAFSKIFADPRLLKEVISRSKAGKPISVLFKEKAKEVGTSILNQPTTKYAPAALINRDREEK